MAEQVYLVNMRRGAPREYTYSEIEQARRLILKNKTFAATGDTRMAPLIDALLHNYGYSALTPETIQQRREQAELNQALKTPAGYQGVLTSQGVVYENVPTQSRTTQPIIQQREIIPIKKTPLTEYATQPIPQQQSTIYQEQTGTYRGVPTYNIMVKEQGRQPRLATPEEAEYFRKETNVLQASTKKVPVWMQKTEAVATTPIVAAKQKYYQFKESKPGKVFYEGPQLEGYKFDESSGQFLPIKDYEWRQRQGKKAAANVEYAVDLALKPIASQLETQQSKSQKEFNSIIKENIKGVATYPIKEPVKTRTALVTGGLLGKFGTGEKLFTKFFGKTIGAEVLGKGAAKVTGGLLLTGYAASKGMEIKKEPTIEKRARKFGEVMAEFGLLGTSVKMPKLEPIDLVKEPKKISKGKYIGQVTNEKPYVFTGEQRKGTQIFPKKYAPPDIALKRFKEIKWQEGIAESRFINQNIDDAIMRSGKAAPAKVRPEIIEKAHSKSMEETRIKKALEFALGKKPKGIDIDAKINKALKQKNLFKAKFYPTKVPDIALKRFKEQKTINSAINKRLGVSGDEKLFSILKEKNLLKFEPARVNKGLMNKILLESRERKNIELALKTRQKGIPKIKGLRVFKYDRTKPRFQRFISNEIESDIKDIGTRQRQKQILLMEKPQEILKPIRLDIKLKYKPKIKTGVRSYSQKQSSKEFEKLIKQKAKYDMAFERPLVRERALLFDFSSENNILKSLQKFNIPQKLKQPQRFRQPQSFAKSQQYKFRSLLRFAQPQRISPTQRQYKDFQTTSIKQVKIPVSKRKIFPFDFDLKPGRISRPSSKSFDVFIIQKHKPKTIASGLSRTTALDIGTRAVSKSLRATFGIKESLAPLKDITSGGEFTKYRNLFRAPTKKSAYRKYGDVFVQKQTRVGRLGGRLAFEGEIREIQGSRARRFLR